MKKTLIVLSGLFLSIIMQAQDRPQPKPGPAPVVNVKKPESFTLSNGLKVMVVENTKLPRVSFSLSIDNAPYSENEKKGVSDLTSSLIGNGSKKISKDAFNEEIDFLGANIFFRSNGAYASTLSKYSKRIMELMAEGALNHDTTDSTDPQPYEGRQDRRVKTGVSLIIAKQLFQDSNIAFEYFLGVGMANVTREYFNTVYDNSSQGFTIESQTTEKTAPNVQFGFRIGFGN
jgi:hypothetical protein